MYYIEYLLNQFKWLQIVTGFYENFDFVEVVPKARASKLLGISV